MSERNSDDDIRQYLPDLESIYREADPARAEEKHKKALDNPELDEALDELKQGLNTEEQPFQFPVVPAQPKAPAAAEAAPPAAPSPWASDAALPIDKAMLPSSLAPAAVPPVTSPSPPRGAMVTQAHGRRWQSRWILSALGVLAVLGSLTTWRVCSTTQVPSASPAASSPVAAPASVSASAATVPQAAPAPPPPAVDASAGTTASSRAPPVASATPQSPRRAPVRPVPAARPLVPDIMH